MKEEINGKKVNKQKEELLNLIEKQSENEFLNLVMAMLSSFRVPLTSIRGYVDLLEKGEFKGREEMAYKKINEGLKRLFYEYETLYSLITKYCFEIMKSKDKSGHDKVESSKFGENKIKIIKIMNKKIIMSSGVALSILIILISGAFYWFQIRPANIRKDCIKKYPSAFYNGAGRLGASDEAGYKRCLMEHGLTK